MEEGKRDEEARKMVCMKYEEDNRALPGRCACGWKITDAFLEGGGRVKDLDSVYKFEMLDGHFLLEVISEKEGVYKHRQWHIKDNFTGKEAASFVKQYREFEEGKEKRKEKREKVKQSVTM